MALAANALCTVAEVKALLNIATDETSYDTVLETLVNYASDRIETYVGTPILNTDHEDYYDGLGGNVLIPDHYPIVSVSSFQIDEEEVDEDDYYVYDSYIYTDETLTEGNQNIYLSYTAGWGEDKDNIPYDFKYACIILVIYWFRRYVAAYSSTFGEPDEISGNLPPWPIPKAVAGLLDPYAKVNVG